jgi:histidinol-phosphate aminotransferase
MSPPFSSPRPLAFNLEVDVYKPGESKLPGFDKPIKLASNENPFGPSPKAKAAFIEAAAKLEIYPEPTAQKLREAIGARYGIDPARIMCGAGSDEIFFLLTRAYLEPGDEIIVTEHSFSIYEIAAKQSGAITRIAKDRGMDADVDALLTCVTPKTKLLFLANPNNPTGTYLPFSEIKRLHAGLPEHVLLILDAAYAEYVRRNDYSSGLEMAGECENVLMTRTFSKIYGLAAARLGWAYGPQSVIDALNRARGPFNVSTPAMMAGIAAMQDQDFADMSADHNARELTRVTEALEAMGVEVTPSAANFLLAHFGPEMRQGGGADKVDAHLRSRGFIVRGMKGYGLPDSLRISIGSTEQNSGLLAALKDYFS